MTRIAAAVVVQSAWRRYTVRRDVLLYVENIFSRYHDEASGFDYYQDEFTGLAQWERPRLLGRSELAYRECESEQATDTGLLAEPAGAPPAATVAAMQRAWEAIMPPLGNPDRAMPLRIDVYNSWTPQRCIVVNSSDLAGYCGVADTSEWFYDTSFFAFSAPVPHSTEYSVWSAEGPLRCKVRMHVKQQVEGKTDDTDFDDVADWRLRFRFWAFYGPAHGTLRLNVQQVPNPIRQRLSEEPAARGGWGQLFSFFSFPTVRVAVLDAVCLEDPRLARGMLREMEEQESAEVHPPVEALESDETATTWWCRRFEFVAFKPSFPGCVRFRVMRKPQPLLQDPDMSAEEKRYATDVHYSAFKLLQHDGAADDVGWEQTASFHAFPVPMPGTTRFYYMEAREAPKSRFRVTLRDHVAGWRTVLCFYAYSTRAIDAYPVPLS